MKGYIPIKTVVGELAVVVDTDIDAVVGIFPVEQAQGLGPLVDEPSWFGNVRELSANPRHDIAEQIPTHASGTKFQCDVLMAVSHIPPGEVRSYSQLAMQVWHPRAVRAVGSAVKRNPIPWIIPCHRVVRNDGSLGNYSMGGPDSKQRLLAAEGVLIN